MLIKIGVDSIAHVYTVSCEWNKYFLLDFVYWESV